MMAVTPQETPVFVLCGGLGTRLKEETEFRPKPMVPIGGKPIAIIGASPGGHEVTGVRAALELTASAARARPFGESMGIGGITNLIDDGRLTDEVTRDALAGYLARFVEFVTAPVPED